MDAPELIVRATLVPMCGSWRYQGREMIRVGSSLSERPALDANTRSMHRQLGSTVFEAQDGRTGCPTHRVVRLRVFVLFQHQQEQAEHHDRLEEARGAGHRVAAGVEGRHHRRERELFTLIVSINMQSLNLHLKQLLTGKLTNFGLGYKDIAAVNPKVIYCSITGALPVLPACRRVLIPR